MLKRRKLSLFSSLKFIHQLAVTVSDLLVQTEVPGSDLADVTVHLMVAVPAAVGVNVGVAEVAELNEPATPVAVQAYTRSLAAGLDAPVKVTL